MDYKDKVAIVTGPSQGIGRAIALGLAQAGAHLTLAEHPDYHQEALKTLKAEIEGIGRKALVALTDVSSVAQIQAMVDKTKEAYGRVDILVNSAGWTGTGLALGVTEEEYDRTMSTTVKSVFFACQAAAKVMIPQGRGRIVNIGSNFAVSAFRTRALYCGAKAAVHQLSRALPWSGRAGRQCERSSALHHRDRFPEANPGSSGLQGVGHQRELPPDVGTNPKIWSEPCCSSPAPWPTKSWAIF